MDMHICIIRNYIGILPSRYVTEHRHVKQLPTLDFKWQFKRMSTLFFSQLTQAS